MIMEKLNLNDKEKEKEAEVEGKYFIFKLVNVSPVPKRRRSSLKEDFNKIKQIKSEKEDEELCSEVIAETMKNTLYNKVVGGFEVNN